MQVEPREGERQCGTREALAAAVGTRADHDCATRCLMCDYACRKGVQPYAGALTSMIARLILRRMARFTSSTRSRVHGTVAASGEEKTVTVLLRQVRHGTRWRIECHRDSRRFCPCQRWARPRSLARD